MQSDDPQRLPGPEGTFDELFGRMMADPVQTQLSWWREFGDVWQIPTPSGPWVFLAHPELARKLLVSHLDHGDLVRATIPAQGRGITAQHGGEWRRSRELMSPMFGRRYLRSLVLRMCEAVEETLGSLADLAPHGRTVDLAGVLGDTTMRVLFRCFFSDEFSADEIATAARHLDQVALYKSELQAQLWRPPGSPAAHQAAGQQAVEELDRMIYRSIRRRRSGEFGDDDIVRRLVDAVDEHGVGFTDDEIRDQLTVLFFGGRETTQWATAWALSFILERPELLARLRHEIDTVLGSDRPTDERLDELRLTKAAFNEALRLQGNLMVPRQLEHDDEFGGYVLAAGTQVCAATLVIHRRPDFWVDPDTFVAERFLDAPSGSLHAFQMLSFGGGPRLCLGMNLAYLEALIILAELLRRWDLALAPGWRRRCVNRYSLVLDGGLPVTVSRRVQPMGVTP